MKIFITGITGFVGSQLAKRLLEQGHDITGLTRDHKAYSKLDLLKIKDKINLISGDIKDFLLIKRILTE